MIESLQYFEENDSTEGLQIITGAMDSARVMIELRRDSERMMLWMTPDSAESLAKRLWECASSARKHETRTPREMEL